MAIRRILSLDGGGIKGVFPIAFLASIEEEVKGSVASYFDLIVGASTGGIIALGLGLGFTAKELLSFYEEFAAKVFGGNRQLRALKGILLSKYNQIPLRKALEERFDNLKIGDSKARLVIPTLNLDTGKVYVYKTSHHPRFEKDYKERVVDVAVATAAAPTYFPSHRNSSGTPLVDGGMWANNPTGLAVIEAIGVLGWKQGNLRVLSLGCTTSPLDVGIGRHIGMGKIYWAYKVADVFMSGQSSASMGTAQLLAGHENVFRISPTVPDKRFGLDSIGEVKSLRGLGFSEAREALGRLKAVFFEKPAEKFNPYHTERN